jgi:uncharacterized repeat protein (TIGR01451 family)
VSLLHSAFVYGADWPNYRSNPAASGYSTDVLQMPLVLKWYVPGMNAEENGIITSGSMIYQAIYDIGGGIAAYDLASGAHLKTYNADLEYSTPAVSNKKIYAVHRDMSNFAYLYCIDTVTEALLWSYPLISSNNSNAFNGVVCDDNYVYVYCPGSPNGIWVFDKNTGAIRPGFPVTFPWYDSCNMPGIAVDNGRIFIYTTNNANLHGYAPDGSILPNFPISLPALAASNYSRERPNIINNKVYIYARSDAATNLKVYGYDIATGLPVPGFPVSAGQVETGWYNAFGCTGVYENIIYALDGKAKLYAFNADTGALQTGFPAAAGSPVDAVYSSPSVSGNNIVFVNAGRSKTVYAIGGAGRPDAGTILWQYTLTTGDSQGFDLVSPVITGGCLIESLDGGSIYVFGPPLAVFKTADKETANINDTIQYTLTLNTNGSPGQCTNVVLADTLPPGMSYVAGSGSPVPAVAGNVISWNIGAVLPDSVTTYSFRAVVTGCQASVTNTASAYCSEYPAFTSNDVITLITGGACGTLTITPTITPSRTITQTRTRTFTLTPTPSPTTTATVSRTFTKTFTRTVTGTPTFTATATLTATFTGTPTLTVTSTLTATVSPTPVPLVLTLKGNFPNPFTYETMIAYHLTVDADVEIKIYTVTGEVVFEQTGIKGLAGHNSFPWNGRNMSNKRTASGVFIYKVSASTKIDPKRSVFSKMACVK